MKKLFFLIVAIFLTSSLFAKDFEGFLISPGQSFDEVLNEFMSDGWSISYDDKFLILKKEDFYYKGYLVDNIKLRFDDNYNVTFCGITFKELFKNYFDGLNFAYSTLSDYGSIKYSQDYVGNNLFSREFSTISENDYILRIFYVGNEECYILTLSWIKP